MIMATKRQVKKQESKLNAMKAKAAPVVEKVVEKTAPAVEKVVEKTAPAVEKAAEKVVEETKEAAKKVRKAAPKKEMKTTLIVEHQGKQVEDKDMIAAVKKAWTKSGRKIGDIKTMTLYVKPEEAAVYYVINTTETGSVAF
jgi:enoyl-CoA hydratase/carnithine racemase